MKKIILGSSNKHKVAEFRGIFKNFGIETEGLMPLPGAEKPEENGHSFSENADIKALYYSAFVDLPLLADDSGLCVDSLNGEPGIYSSRFAGENATDEDNNLKLLSLLRNEKNKTAKFVCCLSLALKGKIIKRSIGEVKGIILSDLKGKGGFGYDPLFLYGPFNKTFSELTMEEKSTLSHRYHACKNIAPFILEN